MEWKWTKGEPYERSRRFKNTDNSNNTDNINDNIQTHQFSKELEQSAYTSSLNHDENTWDILNQSLSGVGFKVSNKREELDFKISGREMVQQCGFNPFLLESDYANDVAIRDQFLKPVNTTSERLKVSSES